MDEEQRFIFDIQGSSNGRIIRLWITRSSDRMVDQKSTFFLRIITDRLMILRIIKIIKLQAANDNPVIV